MTGRLPDAALDDLRARNPVADVASRLGVTLHRSGRSLVGPCPCCGGGVRNGRFEVVRDDAWVCAVCQEGGDVIRLVERVLGLDFRAAVDWLGGAAPVDPARAEALARERAERQARRDAQVAGQREAERVRLWRLWTGAGRAPGTLVEAYLRARLCWVPGLRLRFGASVPYFHGETRDAAGRTSPRVVHRGPAMLAPILRPDGHFTGLHITWLDPAGTGKATVADPETGEVLKAKKMRGSVKAGRIELLPDPARAPARLILGEGIETVATAAAAEGVRPDTAYWSALDLGNLGGPAAETVAHPTERHANGHPKRVPGPVPDLDAPAIPVPGTAGDVTLIGDGDSDRYLTATTLARFTARHRRPGRVIRHAWAPDGADLNDVARGVA